MSKLRASQMPLVVKNLPANVENIEMRVRFLGWEDAREEGIVTHSSIIAWRIAWAEEPGEQQFIHTHRSRSVVSNSLRPHGS